MGLYGAEYYFLEKALSPYSGTLIRHLPFVLIQSHIAHSWQRGHRNGSEVNVFAQM